MNTLDNPELVIDAHRATYAALAKYAAGLQGMTPETIARLLLGASACVAATTLGESGAAAALREVADKLELDTPRLN